MALIRSIIGFFLILALSGFAILNRDVTTLAWSPMHDPYELPLYVVILASLAAGFLIGSFTTWAGSAKTRKTKRAQKKQIKALEKELVKAEKTTPGDTPPSDFFPALTHKDTSKTESL